MARDKSNRAAILNAELSFAKGDDRFMAEFRKGNSPQPLAALTDRWVKDHRPWAREQLLAYLGLPFNCPGHHPVIKRILRHAEKQQDHELMALLMVQCDRAIRLKRKIRGRYEWVPAVRQTYYHQEEVLIAPRNSILPPEDKTTAGRDPRTGNRIYYERPNPPQGHLYSYHTRRYLRRRTWRYFRKLGHQKPLEYVAAVSWALMMYEDADLSAGEHLLENWGLMNACFRQHPALEFPPKGVRLSDDATLSQLEPAPKFAPLWAKAEAFASLYELLTKGRSLVVRLWASQLLKKHHAARLGQLSTTELFWLLEHEDEAMQQFGIELLAQSPSVSDWPLENWFKLLNVENPNIQVAVCELMTRFVTGDRLSLDQCLQLACKPATPIAQLGWRFLQSRDIKTDAERQTLTTLSQAKCGAVAGELTAWALKILGSAEHYRREQVCEFFDSLTAEVRAAAWAWLTPQSPGHADAALWSRLLETPFDEVRFQLIDRLQQRSKLPGTSPQDLAPIWTSVLLGVHRGGRHKPKAVAQLAETLARQPEHADQLLPVLAVAVRSIRGPESRAGLSAIVSLLTARPELSAAIAQHLPEFQCLSPVSS